ncbi:MAG: DUF3108 domain-containing protein [bacterium]|nr:DUF3108 domain-containing protein [bacterium]
MSLRRRGWTWAQGAFCAAGLTIGLAAHAVGAVAPANSPPAHFRGGEVLTFELRWGRMSVAQTLLSVEGPFLWNHKKVLRYRATTHTIGWLDRVFRVRDSAESYVDAKRLSSYRLELRQHQGQYQSQKWYTFDGKKATYVRAGRPPRHYETPGDVQDALSAFYKVRARGLKPGQNFEIPVFDSKRNWRVRVRVVRQEKLESLWGPMDTYLVEPELKGDSFFRRRGRVWIWVTTDPLHVPIRLESTTVIGPFIAHLVKTQGLPSGSLRHPPRFEAKSWRPTTKIVDDKRVSPSKNFKFDTK